MVDSVKNYGITGVSGNVELGKGGPRVISNSDDISLFANADTLARANIAAGTDDAHAVTKQQMDDATGSRVQNITETVTYDGGNQFLFTVPANTTILSTMIETTSGNWTNYNSTTNITVGDAGDNARLYGVGFEPDGSQQIDETNHKYTAETDLYAYVTQGGASAGTATIRVMLRGAEVDQTAP
jgi:hypothetical protein